MQKREGTMGKNLISVHPASKNAKTQALDEQVALISSLAGCPKSFCYVTLDPLWYRCQASRTQSRLWPLPALLDGSLDSWQRRYYQRLFLVASYGFG